MKKKSESQVISIRQNDLSGLLGAQRFGNINTQAMELARKSFTNPAIINDVINNICLALLKEPTLPADEQKWVAVNFPKAVENYFKDLRSFCFQSAFEMVSNPDIAEDVAHESITSLLQTDAQITYIKPWLKRVVLNKLAQHFNNKARANELVISVIEQGKSLDLDAKTESKRAVSQLALNEIEKLLNRRDFARFKKINQCKNLSEYAASLNINYQTARLHSHEIRTNLKAAYLRASGWDGTPEVLTYRQLVKIKGFINSVLEVFSKADSRIAKKYYVHMDEQQVQSVFNGATELIDWGIDIITNQVYQVYVYYSSPESPMMALMRIKLHRSNRIIITECARMELISDHALPEDFVFLVREGKPAFSFEEISRLLQR